MAEKDRLDRIMVRRGLVSTRSRARTLILGGWVLVDGRRILKPGKMVQYDSELTIIGGNQYVSRGGLKLEAGIKAFSIEVRGKVCADVGASTGGFTDCLLRYGADSVYAVDVGRGQLHPWLVNDNRVINMEEKDVRDITRLPKEIELAVVDVSFISSLKIMPTVRHWLSRDGEVVLLIKPQFEAGPGMVSKKGILPADQAMKVVSRVVERLAEDGWEILGLTPSPIKGMHGNKEYLVHLRQKADTEGKEHARG